MVRQGIICPDLCAVKDCRRAGDMGQMLSYLKLYEANLFRLLQKCPSSSISRSSGTAGGGTQWVSVMVPWGCWSSAKHYGLQDSNAHCDLSVSYGLLSAVARQVFQFLLLFHFIQVMLKCAPWGGQTSPQEKEVLSCSPLGLTGRKTKPLEELVGNTCPA